MFTKGFAFSILICIVTSLLITRAEVVIDDRHLDRGHHNNASHSTGGRRSDSFDSLIDLVLTKVLRKIDGPDGEVLKRLKMKVIRKILDYDKRFEADISLEPSADRRGSNNQPATKANEPSEQPKVSEPSEQQQPKVSEQPPKVVELASNATSVPPQI